MANEDLYKVVKLKRSNNKKTVLIKNLPESEAQRIVKSFPSSDKEMVYYTKQ